MPVLPPLNALKAFESAARLGSFVRAGQELGVTAPAVSQQVKLLEDYVGLQLFSRNGNRLTLTDAGVTVLPALSEGFERLASINRLAQHAGLSHRLTISAVPSVASRWLPAILADFARHHPDIDIDLRIEDDPVAFDRHGIDLRFCYGEHLYPGQEVERLPPDHLVAVCAPDFRAQLPEPDQLPSDRQLIHTDWGPAFASLPGWSDWFDLRKAGRTADGTVGHRAGTSATAIDLAVLGLGVVLGQGLLVKAELERGRLVRLPGPAIAMPHRYCLVSPTAARNKPGLRGLKDLLRQHANPLI